MRGDRATEWRRLHDFRVVVWNHFLSSACIRLFSLLCWSPVCFHLCFLCTSLAKLCAYAARRTVLNLIGKNWKAGQAWDGRTVQKREKDNMHKTSPKEKSTGRSHLKVLDKCRLQEKRNEKKTVTAGPSYGSINTTNEINVHTSNKAGREKCKIIFT